MGKFAKKIAWVSSKIFVKFADLAKLRKLCCHVQFARYAKKWREYAHNSWPRIYAELNINSFVYVVSTRVVIICIFRPSPTSLFMQIINARLHISRWKPAPLLASGYFMRRLSPSVHYLVDPRRNRVIEIGLRHHTYDPRGRINFRTSGVNWATPKKLRDVIGGKMRFLFKLNLQKQYRGKGFQS